MDKRITPVTLEEHKVLIDTLSSHEYVYLFDARVRTAITFSPVENCFYVCVCNTDSLWIIIDTFRDVENVVLAFNACAKAITASTYEEFAHDMDFFGKVGKRSKGGK